MASGTKSDVELRLEVEDLLYAYADCLDHGDITKWADFFTDDCLYKLISKENWDLGLPLGTIFAEGRGGLLDRIAAVTQTSVDHDRALTRLITNPRVLAAAEGRNGSNITAGAARAGIMAGIDTRARRPCQGPPAVAHNPPWMTLKPTRF